MYDFENNFNNLKNICKNQNVNIIKLNKLNDFIENTYPIMDQELKSRFEKGLREDEINIFLKKSLKNIMNVLINNVENDNLFNDITTENEYRLNQIIIIIYNYLIDMLDLRNAKYSIYLEINEIDFEDFRDLSITSTLALCELKYNSVDVKQLNGMGNWQIDNVNDFANGKFEEPEYGRAKGTIAAIIDNCLDTGIMQEIDCGDTSLIFEKSDDGNIYIYDYSELKIPLAICNLDNEFLSGNYENIMSLYNVNKTSKEISGIDRIINEKLYEENKPEPPAELLEILNMIAKKNFEEGN